MHLLYHVMSSPHPLGLLFLAASEKGLRHVEFMDRRSLKRTIATHEAGTPGATWEPSLFELRPLADQLEELLTGARKSIDWPLDLSGDELSQAVQRALMKVPYGEVCTVAELARAAGEPRNVRAVAQAVLTNPLAIVVPCHRVLGADGNLSNYVGGLPRKKFLLMVEQRFKDVGGLDENRVIGELYRRVTTPAAPVRSKQKPVTRKRPAAVAAHANAVLKPRPAAKAAAARSAAIAKPPIKAAPKPALKGGKPAGRTLAAKPARGTAAMRASAASKANGSGRAAGRGTTPVRAAKKPSR